MLIPPSEFHHSFKPLGRMWEGVRTYVPGYNTTWDTYRVQVVLTHHGRTMEYNWEMPAKLAKDQGYRDMCMRDTAAYFLHEILKGAPDASK